MMRHAGGDVERSPDSLRRRRRRADRTSARGLAGAAPATGAARRQAGDDTRPIDPAIDERPARQRRGPAHHRQRAAAGAGVGRLGGPAARVRDGDRRGASAERARGRNQPRRSRARDHNHVYGNDAAARGRRARAVGRGGARGVRRQDHQAPREGVADRAGLRADDRFIGSSNLSHSALFAGWSGTCVCRRSTRRLSSNESARCSRATGRPSISSRTTPRRKRRAWIARSARTVPTPRACRSSAATCTRTRTSSECSSSWRSSASVTIAIAISWWRRPAPGRPSSRRLTTAASERMRSAIYRSCSLRTASGFSSRAVRHSARSCAMARSANCTAALRERDVVRSANNPIADIAEQLVAAYYGGKGCSAERAFLRRPGGGRAAASGQGAAAFAEGTHHAEPTARPRLRRGGGGDLQAGS